MNKIEELEIKYNVQIVPYIYHIDFKRCQRYMIGIEGKDYKTKLTMTQVKKLLADEKDIIEELRVQYLSNY